MSEPVIQCSHLTHYYGKRKIYEDLNFEVQAGKILGLLGKNGTGKTTTINILMGYLKPTAGQCSIYGEPVQQLSAATRSRIALLLEGHVQYSFMNVEQIERYYAPFYPRWNRDAYYELVRKLKIAPRQRIATMSNGQRSQVALGLIMAQNADMMVLDDFSLGLDPGYRRLFVDYLRDYALAEGKTVFLTSHIIQDMERLVDDCIVMDYGRIITHMGVEQLINTFHRYTFDTDCQRLFDGSYAADSNIFHPEKMHRHAELYSFLNRQDMEAWLTANGVEHSGLKQDKLTLEDAFIGLTGKY